MNILNENKQLKKRAKINSNLFSIFLVVFFLSSFLFSPHTTLAAGHPIGTNVMSSEGTVFVITTENGQMVRRPYSSAGAFLSYGFNSWGAVVKASPEDLTLPYGSFVQPQDGSIFCSDRSPDKGTCYFISQGKKFGFTNEQAFNGYGFSFKYAQSGDVSWLPLGNDLISEATKSHPVGALIFTTTGNTANPKNFMVVGNLDLYKISNNEALKSWGYNGLNAIPANSSDMSLPILTPNISRLPGQLSLLNSLPTSMEFRVMGPEVWNRITNRESELFPYANDWIETGLSGDYLIKIADEKWHITEGVDQDYWHMEFNPAGTAILANITSDSGGALGFFINGHLSSTPIIRSTITNGIAYVQKGKLFFTSNQLYNDMPTAWILLSPSFPIYPAPTPVAVKPEPRPQEKIIIKGDADCISDTTLALNLLAQKSPASYQDVESYIGIIECVKGGTGIAAEENPPYVTVGDQTRANTVWYAGALVHESHHSKLYHQYLLDHPGEPLPAGVWTGREAESLCIDAQYKALQDMGAGQSTLDYVKNAINTNYWEQPNTY